MLSILIPTYNYNIVPLVTQVHQQCIVLGIDFEIIVVDDASTMYIEENTTITKLANVTYKRLTKNAGRSYARNHLAYLASYENLLFLDADTLPIHTNFIAKYSTVLQEDYQVVYGGIFYQMEKPDKYQILRWVYGVDRESVSAQTRKKHPFISLLTLNFLIKKSVITKVPFNENIPNLRHEDTLFSFNLKENKINIAHIENAVWHLGLEDSKTFLKKSEESVWSLHHLISQKLIPIHYTKLGRTVASIKKTRLTWLVLIAYYLSKRIIQHNLLSKKPSLFLMDFYRLGYYIHISKS